MSVAPEPAPFQTLLLFFEKPDSKPPKHRPSTLQRAAGKEKCSSAEHIVRKSVGSEIFSLLTHSRSKVRGGQKTILIDP